MPVRDAICSTLRSEVSSSSCARRTLGEETEFVSLTFFDDLDAVRGFAGADYETAVVAEDARKVLIRFDERVAHYETAFEA